MKPARIAVLAIALAAAGGSAMIARSMIGSQDAPTVVTTPALDTVDVLIANANVDMGQRLTDSELKWQKWPKDAAQSNFITRESQPDGLQKMSGALASSSMQKGEPINRAKLVLSENSGLMSVVLPKGKRAISIRISPETGAGGFILPNNRVDVIQIRQQRTGADNRETFVVNTVLENVMVRAIDQAWAEKDGKQVLVGKTATLELTPEDMETLALAEAEGRLTLALRSLRDSDPKDAVANPKRRKSGSITVLRYGNRVTTTQN